MLTLPSQESAEIDSMLELNAEEHVPYNVDEVTIRHVLLRRLDSGEASVLAVFARHNVVDDHLKLLNDTGIEPRQVLLSTVCLASAAVYAAPDQPERWALAHLGSGGIEVLVMNQKSIDYLRGVTMAHDWAADIEGAHETLDELAMELRSSLSIYRRESPDGAGVDELYFTSDYAPVDSISDSMMHDVGKETAPARFLEKLTGDSAPDGYAPVLLGGALAAIGVAPFELNLLPEHVHQARRMSGVREQATRIAAVAAVALVLLAAAYYQRVYFYEQYVDSLRKEVMELMPQAQGIAEKQQQLRIIEQQTQRDGNVLDMLAATVAALPEKDINMTRFSFERETGIDIYGRAMTVDEVSRFTSNIRGSAEGPLSMLKTAHRMYESKGVERKTAIMNYRIAIPVTEEEDEEVYDAGDS